MKSKCPTKWLQLGENAGQNGIPFTVHGMQYDLACYLNAISQDQAEFLTYRKKSYCSHNLKGTNS